MPEQVLEPKVEIPQEEPNFKEENGELLVRVDDEPEAVPEEGQPVEGKPEVEPEPVAETPNEPEAFVGKTREEIIEMQLNATKKIQEQGRELGDLRKGAKAPTDDYASKKSELVAEKKKLARMDGLVDPEAYEAQLDKIVDLESEVDDLRAENVIGNRVNATENARFADSHVKQLQKELSYEFNSDEKDTLNGLADRYKENGKLTENSYFHAMTDLYGREKVAKFYAISGEQKARTDIGKAQTKEIPKVSTTGESKTSSYAHFDKLSVAQQTKWLNDPKRTVEELNAIKKYMPKIDG